MAHHSCKHTAKTPYIQRIIIVLQINKKFRALKVPRKPAIILRTKPINKMKEEYAQQSIVKGHLSPQVTPDIMQFTLSKS